MTELLVNIDVDDLEKAVAFYGEAFGLTVGRHFGPLDELLGGSSPRASPTTDQKRFYGRHWTPVHLDIVVNDTDIAVTRAERAGVPEREVQTYEWGRIAQMADPFGHGFCLIEFLGRGYDKIADKDRFGRRMRRHPSTPTRVRPCFPVGLPAPFGEPAFDQRPILPLGAGVIFPSPTR